MATSMNSVKMSAGEREDQSVYYIAESGATMVLAEIEETLMGCPSDVEDLRLSICPDMTSGELLSEQSVKEKIIETINIDSFETNLGKSSSAKVSIVYIGESDENPIKKEFKIISTGEIGNRKRTVEGNFTLSNLEGSSVLEIPNNLTLFTYGNIFNGEKINGDITTTSKNAKSIKVTSGSKISGNIYVSENNGINALNLDSINASDPARNYYINKIKNINEINYKPISEFAFPTFPNFESYNTLPDEWIERDAWNKHQVIKDGDFNLNNTWYAGIYKLDFSKGDRPNKLSFNKFNVSGNSNLNIYTGNKDVTLVVQDFNLDGLITIHGTGKLNIYVKDKFTFGSGNINKGRDINLLNFYVAGPTNRDEYKNITIAADMEIFGSVFVDNINLNLTGSGRIRGHIFSNGKNIDLTGGGGYGNTLIFAPNALVKIINSSGSDLKGTIISDSYYGTGGANITYGYIDTKLIDFLNTVDDSVANMFLEKKLFTEAPVK